MCELRNRDTKIAPLTLPRRRHNADFRPGRIHRGSADVAHRHGCGSRYPRAQRGRGAECGQEPGRGLRQGERPSGALHHRLARRRHAEDQGRRGVRRGHRLRAGHGRARPRRHREPGEPRAARQYRHGRRGARGRAGAGPVDAGGVQAGAAGGEVDRLRRSRRCPTRAARRRKRSSPRRDCSTRSKASCASFPARPRARS